MENTFNFIAKYYDLLYEEKDTHSEVLYLDNLLKKYGSEIKSVLEFGLGTGRHAKKLIDLGYKVAGVERCAQMCSELDQIKGLDYSIGDIEFINLNDKFDCILSLFHVISYQTTNEKLINVFNNANLHLNKGGIFIFDIWYSPAVYSIKPSVRVKRFSNSDLEITKIAEPFMRDNLNVVDVNYTFFVKDKSNENIINFKELHKMRHFSITEIELICSLSGFKCIHVEEWLTKRIPSDNSWGVCFILKKK